MWGVMDIVQLGERLLAIHPGAPTPLDGVDELEVTGEATLRIAKGNGFGSVGETIFVDFDEAGAVSRIRGGGGMSMWPMDSPIDHG